MNTKLPKRTGPSGLNATERHILFRVCVLAKNVCEKVPLCVNTPTVRSLPHLSQLD